MSVRTHSMNKYINTIANRIYENQTLCKYLYYDQNDPLSQPDIVDTTILYTDFENQKLLFKPFIVSVEDYRMTRMSVIIDDIYTDRSKYFKVLDLDFVVVCHNDLWNVEVDVGDIGIRPLLIWDELDSLFVDYITRGVGSDKFNYAKLTYFNEKFTGYRICYRSLSLPI